MSEGVHHAAAPGMLTLPWSSRSQAGGVGMAQRVPDLRYGGEQWVGGLDERVEPTQGGEVGGGRLTVERRSEAKLPGAPACDRLDYGGVSIPRGSGVVDPFPHSLSRLFAAREPGDGLAC